MNAALSAVRYGCTALAGTNKVGELKKDADGYYTVVVGGLGVYNSAGAYYDIEAGRQLLQSSGAFIRRVNNGACRGEYGHPKLLPGMTNEQFAQRLLSVYEENACVHFKEIWLDSENVTDNKGKQVIAIMAKIIPSGPFAHILEKSLNNPSENVCFSIRSFTEDVYDPKIGTKRKYLRHVVTFDYVNEPGIAIANKFKSPALEQLDDHLFTRGDLERSVKQSQKNGLGNESVHLLTVNELFENLGWNLAATIKKTREPICNSW